MSSYFELHFLSYQTSDALGEANLEPLDIYLKLKSEKMKLKLKIFMEVEVIYQKKKGLWKLKTREQKLNIWKMSLGIHLQNQTTTSTWKNQFKFKFSSQFLTKKCQLASVNLFIWKSSPQTNATIMDSLNVKMWFLQEYSVGLALNLDRP